MSLDCSDALKTIGLQLFQHVWTVAKGVSQACENISGVVVLMNYGVADITHLRCHCFQSIPIGLPVCLRLGTQTRE